VNGGAPLPIVPYVVDDVDEQWAAWNGRCAVSHEGQFAEARNGHVAFHRPAEPLSALRVALLTSGGAYVEGDAPFDMRSHAGDDSVRWIPRDVSVRDLRFAHDHYDHTDPDRDPNCMFPIERLRDLAAAGVVGGAAAWHVGFMGFIPNPARFARETIPRVVDRLRQDHVGAAVLSPG
jgi:D-proline reductase (dithiol) PrdB